MGFCSRSRARQNPPQNLLLKLLFGACLGVLVQPGSVTPLCKIYSVNVFAKANSKRICNALKTGFKITLLCGIFNLDLS